MNCPFCEYHETRVIDTRPTDEGQKIRRRRECIKCKKRFTTYEKVENIQLMVIKKDKTRESFDRDKIVNGIIKACEKRSIPLKKIQEIADKIEKTILMTWKMKFLLIKLGKW